MGVDPSDETKSPLWAFSQNRELNRLALRTKLPLTGTGALAYLKHDSLGPAGAAAVVLFNPGQAQTLTVDLSLLPKNLLDGSVIPHDLFGGANATDALSKSWSVAMKAGEMKAFAGFSLGTFAPRKGKRTDCKPDDGFRQAAPNSTTLQACFLECQKERRCENVFLDHVDVGWLKPVPPIACTLLGAVAEPARACKAGTGTLVKKLAARPPPLIDGPLPLPA